MKVGTVRFASPVSMRNEFSHVRIHYKVSGNMFDKGMLVGLPFLDEKTGKTIIMNKWMNMVDYQVETQFSEYKNNALMFGRSNRNSNGEYTNIGKSGNVIRTGSGLMEQMEVSNVEFYNDPMSILKRIENMLYNLSYSKIDMKDRKFVIHTGEKGAALFHKAVMQEISGWTQFNLDNSSIGAIRKTTSEMHSNSLAAGFQFTEWLSPNGLKISLKIDSYLDDPVRNKVQHPLGGPASSYSFYIYDIGTMDQPNIFRCTIKGKSEFRGYESGPFRNPFTGETDNTHASYDEDSAQLHKMATLGICVLDPTRTAALLPSLLQA